MAGRQGAAAQWTPGAKSRGIVLMVLAVLLVVSLGINISFIWRTSATNSRNIVTMQEQCRDAVAMVTTLSRTASSSSSATLGKIRADVHAIDVINQMKAAQDGQNNAYIDDALIQNIYTILDSYSNQLITGMSTMEEQTNLSTAIQALSDALAGLIE